MPVETEGLPDTLPPHWLVFLGQWLRDPRRMASIAPSGRQLGRLMASALPPDAQHVVELGAGTGAITQALLENGIQPRCLLAVEMSSVLHQCLQQRFPDIHAVCGDARDLVHLVQSTGDLAPGKVDAICSSLGLLTMPQALQHEILDAAFRTLRPEGAFIQYTYGFTRPLATSVARELGLTCHGSGFAWRNLPPARVFVYRRML